MKSFWLGGVVFSATFIPPVSSLLALRRSPSSVLTPTTNGAFSMATPALYMGLYDQPLPPLPDPREDPNSNNGNNKNIDDDGPALPPMRLFRFNKDGTEARNLLPRLSRTLESGVDCYFEESDRLVKNLVKKTDCRAEDAAWALEACKGDITEAWLCISTARRTLLEKNTNPKGPGSLQSEVSSLMAKNELEIFKEQLKEQEKLDKKNEYFSGKPDQEWLPQSNPKPIDDEPWFTG